ncbi:MAG: LysM peptidoglycan-binding domain-containing protein [Phycisphaerae bacterium]|nr:LysM peptidoglycan-binding domain-containing protein [Phycisphaerae bacterium]NUQ44944.1 LysM peptidoglycan-binding domain-containing protein [Phycisphaerae bacterium]
MRRDVGIGVFLGVLLTGTAAAWFFWQRDRDPDLIAVESFTTGLLAEAQAKADADEEHAKTVTEKPPPRRPPEGAAPQPVARDADRARDTPAARPLTVHRSPPTEETPPVRAAETARLSSSSAPSAETADVATRPAETSASTPVTGKVIDASHMAGEPPRPTTPTAPAAPRKPRIHVVQENESLSQIAQQYYGDSTRYRDILKANPEIKNEHKLRIGDRLLIPDESNAAETPMASTSPATRTEDAARKVRTHVVRDNDTLYDIARRLLGDGERWRDLHRWNRKVIGPDETKLRKGMVLKLEEDPPPASRPTARP